MNLRFEKLQPQYLTAAAALCSQCVGENLYPREFLENLEEQPGHTFYLLLDEQDEIAAYFYENRMDCRSAADLTGLSQERILLAAGCPDPIIGNLQSIGVAEAYRNQGLSNRMVEFWLRTLRIDTAADLAFGMFWKPGGQVPMEKTLLKYGFSYLDDVRRPWYGKSDLFCPFCGGRCSCDGAVYYKRLQRK